MSVEVNGVLTENEKGRKVKFVFNCGADHLEATEWKSDFPATEGEAGEQP